MANTLLEARRLGRRPADAWLLKDVSLSIAAGQRVALVGPSGSGKSLLLRSLALLDPIEEGEILWRGRSVADGEAPAFRSRVIYLHQRPALAEGSVEENLRQVFELRVHRGRRYDRDRVVERLQSLGRGESFLKKNAAELSGGEAQLTALLRAIQLEPTVLLLDEPTAALDAEAARLIEDLVAAWLAGDRQQRAYVWVTHESEQARRVGETVLGIRDGVLESEHDGELH